MDGRTDKQKSPCVLQDIVPFGAAALLPLTPFHNHASRATGIADHILQLGDLFLPLFLCFSLPLSLSHSVSLSLSHIDSFIVFAFLFFFAILVLTSAYKLILIILSGLDCENEAPLIDSFPSGGHRRKTKGTTKRQQHVLRRRRKTHRQIDGQTRQKKKEEQITRNKVKTKHMRKEMRKKTV